MLIDNVKDYDLTDKVDSTSVANAMRDMMGKEKNRVGNLDLVTGFFTIRGLNFLKEIMADETIYRMVLAKIAGSKQNDDKNAIDMLSDDYSIEKMLCLKEDAKKAIEFLSQDSVTIRAITDYFCHAKTYIYKDKNEDAFDCYITGSSNLTDAGLGMIERGKNIELNVAERGHNGTYKEHVQWFGEMWEKLKSKDKVHSNPDDPKSPMIPVKEYFINLIKGSILQPYTPEQIYYKILFELFKTEIDLDTPEDLKEMTLLQDSTIYKTLFEYQQKGVISLIKMLRKYNGAILGDAVGLGKTFSALAVIKYFQNNGYTVLVLCPKKLQSNWEQYKKHAGSRFERDEFDYIVRYHTDLQNDRLEKHTTGKLSFLKRVQKLLIVVDESHNLRNDKSTRYETLLNELIKSDGTRQRDVKVLQLSATPINNRLTDVRNQFNLIAKGNDHVFSDDLGVDSLVNLFMEAQKKFTEWSKKDNRKVRHLIDQLPNTFFSLADKLIVARTRKMIEETTTDGLHFPDKLKPINIYKGIEVMGKYNNFQQIYDALLASHLTAYKPSFYMGIGKSTGWQDDRYRQLSLVKMMGTLFVKRLESSWYSCFITVGKVLDVHKNTLAKVNEYIKTKDANTTVETYSTEDEETEDNDITLRGGEIKLSQMKDIYKFQKDLETDVALLQAFYDNILAFKASIEAKTIQDEKLLELIRVIREKQSCENKKLVIFTAYSDTAKYLYKNLSRIPGFEKIACVTGSDSETLEGTTKKFDLILQRFAPYSKLYKEKDWSWLYEKCELPQDENHYDFDKRQWKVDYETWQKCIQSHGGEFKELYNNGIDILIATDCLSEGQNLQDADMQINYDIHWNPVRLIQRFGRIDRIGSRNEKIQAVNFWPASTYDDVLNLQNRINSRMAAMLLVGSEIIEANDDFTEIVEDNPLANANTQKLLDQLRNNSISDIEDDSSQTLSLHDFSLETYRQDIMEYLQHNREFFDRMPLGAYSGFEIQPDLFENIPESLVAVVAYPHRKPGDNEHQYEKLYLMCQPVDPTKRNTAVEMNKAQVLEFLRKNKNKDTRLPQWLENLESGNIQRLSAIIQQWMSDQVPAASDDFLDDLSMGNVDNTSSANPLLEERFKMENFDLLVWEYVTKNN